MLELSRIRPIAEGGNRLVFVHPEDPSRCVKVAHPNVSLAAKRARKGLKGKLKPASAFDDNAEEWQVMQQLQATIATISQHVPHCDGFAETDLGPGLVSGLVRSADNTVALPLKQRLWEDGYTSALQNAVDELAAFWVDNAVPSRKLILHNVVVQQRKESARLWVIDGIGSSDLLPFARWSRTLRRQKAARKIADMRVRIDLLMKTRAEGGDPGRHGFMNTGLEGKAD
ncbi:MAG: PhoP regulatory network YrbL family protein [Pseudomonadaceae bacterium]|nr:PhoP regulatory network YrbL family protein [Pseudomonadaceae bacterium]